MGISNAISRKRCKIEGKLVLLLTKSHMSFRLVPKSVTLNDLQRRNGPFCVISPNSVASGAYLKVVEDVVVKKSTFAISPPDEFLVDYGCPVLLYLLSIPVSTLTFCCSFRIPLRFDVRQRCYENGQVPSA